MSYLGQRLMPMFLIPMYGLFERFSKTRDSEWRLGLVTLKQMLAALVMVVENPEMGVRIVEVPEIRRAELGG
jgi:hypothetical protein